MVAVHKSGLKFACAFTNRVIATYSKDNDNWVLIKEWYASEGSIWTLAWLNDRELLSGDNAGSILLWDSESGKRIKVIQKIGSPIFCLSVPIDSNFILSGDKAGTLCKFSIDGNCEQLVKTGDYVIRILCICEYNNAILVCSGNETISAFDIESLSEKWQFRCIHRETAVSIIHDQVFVAVCNAFVLVLNVNNGELIRQFGTEQYGDVYLAVQPVNLPLIRCKFVD